MNITNNVVAFKMQKQLWLFTVILLGLMLTTISVYAESFTTVNSPLANNTPRTTGRIGFPWGGTYFPKNSRRDAGRRQIDVDVATIPVNAQFADTKRDLIVLAKKSKVKSWQSQNLTVYSLRDRQK